jgi:hypothetical protein
MMTTALLCMETSLVESFASAQCSYQGLAHEQYLRVLALLDGGPFSSLAAAPAANRNEHRLAFHAERDLGYSRFSGEGGIIVIGHPEILGPYR